METKQGEKIPLAQETVHVGKSSATTSRVSVRTTTETINETVREQLESETVEVTRVRIGREVDTPPEVRTQDGVTIVPVLEERLVVEKKLYLVEELHIRSRKQTETVEIPVSLRKQRAIVNRTPTNETN